VKRRQFITLAQWPAAVPHHPQHIRWITWHPFRGSARWRVVESTILVYLRSATFARAYPLMVGAVALIVTVSMTVPFASILIGAILLRREHWREIVVLSSLGSATGGVLLYVIFHYWGWSHLAAAYPDLLQSKAWSDATIWVSAYGTWALLAIAATPLPQTPALIFTAVSRLPLWEVFVALLVGKLVKYGTYGFLAARFPSWFEYFILRDVTVKRDERGRSKQGERP
jgi:membrane protein YqaA with SNARE-associated domain